MGWNTGAIFLKGVTADQAVRLVDTAAAVTEELVGADEATSAMRPDALFAAESGGWAQVWSPALAGVAPPADGLSVVFSSVAGMYGFTLVENGALVRQLITENGEPVVDEGDPLPVEASVEIPSWGPDEDFVWAVVEAVTGTAYDDSLEYRAYATA